jgi:protein PhnA
MSEYPKCPSCASIYTYPSGELLICPECGNEWSASSDASDDEIDMIVKDSNGNILQNGDYVVIIKDLPVKGASKSIKAGTKVKNIRLVDSDHNIDCKIDGFGAMALKSEFVRKG